MTTALVSVIIPVFNGADYLGCAIESVLEQTLQSFELIVVDDGSTDATPDVVRTYGDRIQYVRQENRGTGAAFNHGIRVSSGKYISWLSHDDVFVGTKLEKQISAIQCYAEPAACYTDISYIDANGRTTTSLEIPQFSRTDVLRHVLSHGPMSMASYSILYDRRCLDTLGSYNESLLYCQDWDFLIRLARVIPLVRVPEKLVLVRDHAERGAVRHAPELVQETIRVAGAWLNDIDMEELFPELRARSGPMPRARARVWLGDAFLSAPPWYPLAIGQYARAIREAPGIIPSLIWRSYTNFARMRGGRAALLKLLATMVYSPACRTPVQAAWRGGSKA